MKTLPIATDNDLIDAPPVARRIGYALEKKTGRPGRAFWNTVLEQDIPRYVINKRVILFRMSEIEDWLSSRKKGGVL